MKKRIDLDCIGYLSDVLFDARNGLVPHFELKRSATAEPGPEPESDEKGKLLEFGARAALR